MYTWKFIQSEIRFDMKSSHEVVKFGAFFLGTLGNSFEVVPFFGDADQQVIFWTAGGWIHFGQMNGIASLVRMQKTVCVYGRHTEIPLGCLASLFSMSLISTMTKN